MKHLLLQALLLFPIAARAQPEVFLPSTVDTRSMAMGRTSILSAEGSNALFSNPATLATLEHMDLQIGLRTFAGASVMGENEEFGSSTYPVHVKLDHVSFAMPYALADSSWHLGFGIGYRTYYDFGYKVGDDVTDAYFTSDGGLNTISPGVAISYQDKYFAGISYNKSVNSSIAEEEVDSFTSDIETSGSFFLLGALAHVTPRITVGGMYRSRFDWTFSFEDGDEALWDNPSLWGLGANFQLSSRWTLVSEYRSRPFSKYQRDGRDKIFGVDDGYSVRVGFERGGTVPFRFGFFRDAIAEHDAGEEAPKYLTGATIGFGFPISSVRINLGWEAAYWQQALRSDDELAELFARFRLSARYQFK